MEEETNDITQFKDINRRLLSELTPTFEGRIFAVSYHIVLAIKHSSWEQYKQEGKVVKLPVKIEQPPI